MLDIRQLKVENRQTLIQLGFDPISLLTKPVCGQQVFGTQFRPDVSTYLHYCVLANDLYLLVNNTFGQTYLLRVILIVPIKYKLKLITSRFYIYE